MKIQVFGPGCARCAETENVVREAVKECACPATVEKVTDFKEMMAAGVLSTPAVAIDGVLLAGGRVPARAEVMAWIVRAMEEK